MKRLLFRLIRVLHTWTSRLFLFVAEDNKGVRLHSFCGKWMAGANLQATVDPLTGKTTSAPAQWAAYVFTSSGTVQEVGFTNQAETTAAMHRLARKHLGRHILAPMAWFREGLK